MTGSRRGERLRTQFRVRTPEYSVRFSISEHIRQAIKLLVGIAGSLSGVGEPGCGVAEVEAAGGVEGFFGGA